ncbi:hypothetical protein LSCM1_03202 [Leishmania martiniquensis]|uniref:Uncharacterized protein n=1 Tax=Leishmania martiniquensis TaxID=1580590 RepID=A0A836GYS6_9TRYP|nr:hypothetical protein LSCM1_03202 [Leishmania martiniquensis]
MGCAASASRAPSCGGSQLSYVFSDGRCEAWLQGGARPTIFASTRRLVALLGPRQQQPQVSPASPSAHQPLLATTSSKSKGCLTAMTLRAPPLLRTAAADSTRSRSSGGRPPAIGTLSSAPLLPGVPPQRSRVQEDDTLRARPHAGYFSTMTPTDSSPRSDSISGRSLSGSAALPLRQGRAECQQPQHVRGVQSHLCEITLSAPMPNARPRADDTRADLRICRLMRRTPSGQLTCIPPWPNQTRHAAQPTIVVITTAEDLVGDGDAARAPGHAFVLPMSALELNGANDTTLVPVIQQFRLSTSDRRRILKAQREQMRLLPDIARVPSRLSSSHSCSRSSSHGH